MTIPLIANETTVNWRLTGKPDWLSVEAESGTINANSYVNLRFNIAPAASALQPGEYPSEIRLMAVGGNEVIRKVKLTVNPDAPTPKGTPDLTVTSRPMLTFRIQEGGFLSKPVLLPMASNEAGVSWKLVSYPDWLDISSKSGTIPPNSSSSVTVTMSASASNWAPGEYQSRLQFEAAGGNTVLIGAKLIISRRPTSGSFD